MSFVSKIVGKSKSEHYVLKAEVRSVCKESVRGSSIILIAELEARYVAVGVLRSPGIENVGMDVRANRVLIWRGHQAYGKA